MNNVTVSVREEERRDKMASMNSAATMVCAVEAEPLEVLPKRPLLPMEEAPFAKGTREATNSVFNIPSQTITPVFIEAVHLPLANYII